MNRAKVSERQRQDYLQAMGLQPWFARFRLPAAAVASVCDWPEEFPTPAPAPGLNAPPQLGAVAEVGLRSLKASLGEAAAEAQPAQMLAGDAGTPAASAASTPTAVLRVPTTPEPKEADPATVEEAQSVPLKQPDALIDPGELPHVRLFIAPAPGDGLVIGDLPVLGEPFSRFHQQLLSDLLRSCNRLGDELSVAHFQWPVCEALVAPYGRKGAVEALQGFLRNQQALDQCRWLLLLGRQAAELVLDQSADFDALRGESQQQGRLCIVTHGLNQLMRLPALKAEAWADIRGLLAKLGAEDD